MKSWEKVREHPDDRGHRVCLNLDDWASRVAMRAYAYAQIATGDLELGLEILKVVGERD